MDYTTLARFKAALHAEKTTDDAIIGSIITAASRALDRKLTGVPDADGADYLKLETKTETIFGQTDQEGRVLCYPHKPVVSAVTALSYRKRPFDEMIPVDVARIWADGMQVSAWPQGAGVSHARVQIQISYTGGLAVTADALPADLVEAVTVLAIRYYREAETGLQDSIGVAELGTMIYTKAWPTRVLDMIQPYIRRVGWRYTA